jgi:ABC-2 type transport system permease protein
MRRLLYNFKITFKNKELIFWAFAFPVIMATLFYFAFSNLIHDTGFSAMKIAYVDSAEHQNNFIYHLAIGSMSIADDAPLENPGENKYFKTTYVPEKSEAEQLLKNGDVDSAIYFEDGEEYPKVLIMKNDSTATVVQNILTEIEQTLRAGREFEPANIKNDDKEATDYVMVEFYTLLAMACLYGGMVAMKTTDKNLANMTASGKRIAVAAVSKTRIILGGLLTSYAVQLIGLAILFGYLTLILRLDFGPNLPMTIFFTMIGALTGLSFGTFVSVVFKLRDEAKDGIMTGITMIGCFFGGMMGPSMKYLVDHSVPLLNKVNPSAIISDGYYALTSFGVESGRFWFDVASLLVITAVFSTVAIVILRRQKYDSL